MKVYDAPLSGVKVIEPDRFDDDRGRFMELWNESRYRASGLAERFAQTNVSWSRKGVLRGMHYQWPNPQGKLVSVLEGTVFDVVVDIRRGSPGFGRWYGCELSRDNGLQLWVPEGFAHGFLVLSDTAAVLYDCTRAYDREADRSIAWNDPVVAIAWPAQPRVISEKDRAAPRLERLQHADLPRFDGPGPSSMAHESRPSPQVQ